MKFLFLGLIVISMCLGQRGGNPAYDRDTPETTMPPEQRAALIKADHKKNVEDATELLKLAEAVKTELDKEDALVISVKTIKQTEDIERLAKSIRGRLKRY